MGPSRRGSETWRQRVKRPRESERWANVLTQVERPAPGSRRIYTADREADFYEPLQRCQQRGIDFVIRAYRDRKLGAAASPAPASSSRGQIGVDDHVLREQFAGRCADAADAPAFEEDSLDRLVQPENRPR